MRGKIYFCTCYPLDYPRKIQIINMAKFISNLFADIRGKLNGNVFSKNAYGPIVRNKISPVNPQTTSQSNRRSIMAYLSSSWRSLSDGDRQLWINAAPGWPVVDQFGNTQVLAGNALYIQLNYNAWLAGGTIGAITVPPARGTDYAITGPTAAIAAGAGTMTVNIGTVPTGNKALVYATPPVSQGIMRWKSVSALKRLITTLPAAGTGNQSIATAYTTLYGSGVLVATKKVYFLVYFVDSTTGQRSAPATFSATIAA